MNKYCGSISDFSIMKSSSNTNVELFSKPLKSKVKDSILFDAVIAGLELVIWEFDDLVILVTVLVVVILLLKVLSLEVKILLFNCCKLTFTFLY